MSRIQTDNDVLPMFTGYQCGCDVILVYKMR